MSRVDELRVEAAYWREKHALYRAKTYGPRPTTPGRLKELERNAQSAEERLKHARAVEADAVGG